MKEEWIEEEKVKKKSLKKLNGGGLRSKQRWHSPGFFHNGNP